ncbi:LTA synthase family protein [Azoarcus olearius]|uniref:Membrane protein, alkaline phosphatase superfamily n=1 Tax=Azoarcus sp. (strain BH72) TaxID=418699 RepID=A1KAG6_AZOSB|nr:LTA synthase family protein [Azoarcus olearius]ANQ86364.1 alkaline phosphatase superfamily protein [Azoarcus olearius]CAL95822.1 membrane protein, alkaline phosphatase superfamily [Azoarcus olearius]
MTELAAPARPVPATVSAPVRAHLMFTAAAGGALLLMYSLLRLALFGYNHAQIGATPAAVFVEAFITGVRFDLRLVVYLCVPLLLALASPRALAARRAMCVWLSVMASVTLFLGLIELDFYREFHQRLNSLVFQYVQEDARTVMSMLWYGFPVLRYLLAWALGSVAMGALFFALERRTRAAPEAVALPPPAKVRWLALLLCVPLAVLAARGTLRHGPPMRWGDAYTTDSMFANQLGLNGSLTLLAAAKARYLESGDKIWKATLPEEEATRVVRDMLLTPADHLVDADTAALRRDFTPPPAQTLPVRNVVVILLESFAGHYVGALGNRDGITPNFDRLAQEGLLFTRFFSNGTHTHQGMFATMACFPNLPGFEYLMQMPEGGHRFSGLPQLLSAREYEDVYVYNGDFTWDNQSGFFSNQGMTRFIGRADFRNPAFSDPTWGVSDQDMFARGAEELAKGFDGKPFYALLQSLSNHTPYALPDVLPVERVTGHGSLDEHLTAMRYSDWALGQFFEQARKSPYFKDTLFVVVGDHGFGAEEQLTEMDLHRFNVPLLMIAPGIQQAFGARRDTVGTQIDVVPTIMGRLGGAVRHQCWGRDLLDLPAGDAGRGVIKPSGSDQTVAIVEGSRILVQPKDMDARLYAYQLGAEPRSERIHDAAAEAALGRRLQAFLQVATRSLLDNTAGVEPAR